MFCFCLGDLFWLGGESVCAMSDVVDFVRASWFGDWSGFVLMCVLSCFFYSGDLVVACMVLVRAVIE